MEKIKAINISKEYKIGKMKYTALKDFNIEINKGEIVTILGPSGSGKTTLLNVLSALDTPDSGEIFYDDKNIVKLSDRKKTKFRKEKISFIFQSYNLLENITIKENILVGKSLSKKPLNVDEIINTVGLKKHQNKNIFKLSGGEQQRVSIARAIVKNPDVLFCDEPTGALDEKTGKKVLETLVRINKEYNTTMIMVTHNPGIALMGDRIIKMNSGKIVEEIKNTREEIKNLPWG